MKVLSKRIQRELKTETNRIGHCAIYEDELQRIWPLDEENRRAKIEQFAKEHGFKLSFYKQGLCAIFEKQGHAGRNEVLEIIADNLKRRGWNLGWVSAVDREWRTDLDC
jgi:hypothetical protein